MHAVVILADPNPTSFSHAIAARMRNGLEAAGYQVIVHDLHAEGFRAAMSAEEREAYHSDQPVLDPLVLEHVADLKAAHALIFVYPTWWSSMPAVLKGWLERVMVPGVGFVFNEKNKVRPGLTNLKRLVGVATYDSSWRSVKLRNDNGRRTVTRALRLSTSFSTRSTWLPLYDSDTLDAHDRERFLVKVDRLARSL